MVLKEKGFFSVNNTEDVIKVTKALENAGYILNFDYNDKYKIMSFQGMHTEIKIFSEGKNNEQH
ncbi:hypothetical protein [Anaerovorax sp. IOR16]|uniref:hypothetical protein n=1 Tax=Anaerovorax sp. IOR16 TaxID=2773458 RepID=UPI0019D11809|nr:hypothetical protein [Anaerovorax sp. IOR16]